MLKRVLAALVCLVTMYALGSWAATTWQLQTKLSTAGGTIKVRNNPTQTVVGTVVYTNFTTSAAVPVTVAANAGYNISGLTRNGAAVAIGNYTSHYATTFQKSGGTTQSLVAKFAAQKYTVTGTVLGAGTITPASISVAYGGTATFTANPSFGGSFLTAVAGGSVTDLSGNPVSLPCAVPVKITVSNVTGPGSVVATYTTVRADAGAEQLVLINSLVTLDGSGSVGGDSQLWSQTSGPAVTLAGPDTLRPTFTPATTGTYVFQLTKYLASTPLASATTQVTVVTSLADSMRADCMGCHGSGGVWPAPQAFARWSSSSHKAAGISCVTCHTDGAMPTPVNSFTVNRNSFVINQATAGTVGENYCATCHNPEIMTAYNASLHKSSGVTCTSCHVQAPHDPAASVTACNGCHIDGSGQVVGHPFPMGATDCTTCHNKHNPGSTSVAMPGALGLLHFNNVTSEGYPASYVTSRASCLNCHFDSPANAAVRQQWYSSGHAKVTAPAWMAHDFKTRTGCVQCHTTTGFIAYSTGKVVSAWGVASDKTKEVLTCIGCHKEMTTGVVRTVQPVRPYADDTYQNRDLGISNICMSCHSGVRNGSSISVQLANLADFTNLAVITPHYLAAGGVLHGKGGYHFAGAAPYAYYSSNSHRRIGSNDANGTGRSGACVACHKDENGHAFRVGTALCANCHGATLAEAQLALDRADFDSGLTALAAMLEEKGHPYSPQYPYFSNTNWGSGQAGADTMGAAFNYLLLFKEPGAFAHNSAYAKRLILDSIDYLHNGAVTGNIDTALDYLVARDKITREVADSLLRYKSTGSCSSCHTNNTGSHTAHLDSGFSCAACHSATANGTASLIPGSLAHLNGVTDVEAGLGRSFSYSFATGGGTCSSISCHNNGTAVWGAALGCDGCHGAPPASASHQKHYGGSVAQAAYGATSIAQDIAPNSTAYIMNCGNCHPIDKLKHGNGIVEVELYSPAAPAGSLKALNPASATYVSGFLVYQDERGLAYTKGICSNIYCHSYVTWNSTAIPDLDPQWESKTTWVRNYRTITWGAPALTCSGCHGNPTQNSYLNNDGGAGDSHSWIDPYGYQNLHTYNMGYDPVSCKVCHYDTVKQVNSFTSDGYDVRTLGDVPITGFAKHVNGKKDVVFDKENPYVYESYYGGTTTVSLANATYDPATRTCSNVACHISQTTVKWGTPYRWYYERECDVCHQYGY